jgi:hypothetical protein
MGYTHRALMSSSMPYSAGENGQTRVLEVLTEALSAYQWEIIPATADQGAFAMSTASKARGCARCSAGLQRRASARSARG